MAQWKVFKEKIKLFEHPNADKLQLGKVGQYQVVVQKGLYEDGDEVIFAPEKSVLPDMIAEPYRDYLRGPEKNRVGAARLRGELSMGVIIPLELAFDYVCGVYSHIDEPSSQASPIVYESEYGEDISEYLDITKYEPPIPQSLSGDVDGLPHGHFTHHDVEQFGIYRREFQSDEVVFVTEKIHGSQIAVILTDDDFMVTSKGLFNRGLHIKEAENNAYWSAVRNTELERRMRDLKDLYVRRGAEPVEAVQVFGEVFPVQGGNWTYGAKEPTLRIFDVRINGEHIPYHVMAVYSDFAHKHITDLWVPIITVDKFENIDFNEIRAGKETVSGQELHIREGVVVRPFLDRRASDGTRLLVKVINPAYKETGEEFA